MSAAATAGLADVLSWWNLAFLLPLLAGLALALLSSLGVGDADGTAEVDSDAELGPDIEADVDDLVAGSYIDTDADGALEVGAAAALLGIGRVALMLQLTVLSLSFGVIGWACNRALAPLLPQLFPVSLVAAVVGSALCARVFARVVGQALPREESYGTPFAGLVGCTGRVVARAAPAEGWVQLTDPSGNFIEAHARGHGGAALRQGALVVVVEVLIRERVCLVAEIDDEPTKEEEMS